MIYMLQHTCVTVSLAITCQICTCINPFYMCHVDAYATLNAFLGNCTATRHHVSENSQIIHVSTSYVQPIHLAVIYIQHTLESHIVVHKN